MVVEYEWDEAKNAANILAGRSSFEAIELFEWDTAVIRRSDRYGEVRWTATGLIGDRLYYVVYTMRGERTRIISLRSASTEERDSYVRERA